MVEDVHSFSEAFAEQVRMEWPGARRSDCDHNIWRNYIGAEFGAKGYVWSHAAAKSLARQYCAEYGEAR